MNCLLLFAEELGQNSIAILQGGRYQAVQQKHKLEEGISICGGIINGQLGKVTVLKCESDQLMLQFDPDRDPPPRNPITLIVSVARPQTIKKVIHAATAFGIEALHFVRTEQSEKSYLDSKVLQPDAIFEETLKAREQCIDTIAPEIQIHRRFLPFVEDVLPGIQKEHPDNFCWLADTQKTDQQFSRIDNVKHGFIAVGPEAGWNDFEREKFLDYGFEMKNFGPRMLRTEMAVVTGISQILSRR